MSDTNRLGISITATDTASASIQSLQSTVKGLQQTLRDVGGTAADVGGKITSAIEAEINAINREIAARTGQAAAIRTVNAAIKEQAAALEVVHRTLQQNIDLSMGVGSDRAIKSAAESARVLTTSLSAAAEADARLRNEALLAAAALERQGAAVKTLSGEQFFSMFNRRQGIGQEAISAEESAAVFQRTYAAAPQQTARYSQGAAKQVRDVEQLTQAYRSLAAMQKEIGSGLTLTPAKGFSQTVEELTGIRNSSRTTAEAARDLSIAFGAVVTPVNAAGRGFTSAAAGASILSRESRHVVGLFDSLARGQRGQAISSIGAAARDAGLGVGALSVSMGGLIALVGGAAILRGAEVMGKWATELRASASAAGMSVSQYSALQGVLTSVGLKADEADTTLRRLAVNLSSALADPSSKQAEAFHNMGISQEMLIKNGTDVNGVLHLLADAFARTADDANKAAIMNELLGRGYEKLIPAIQDGSSWLDKLIEKVKEQGRVIDEEGAAKLQKLGESVTELSGKISGGAIQAFSNWAPVIEQVAGALGHLLTVMEQVLNITGKVASAPIGLAESAKSAIQSAIASAQAKGSVPLAPPSSLVSGARGVLGYLGVPSWMLPGTGAGENSQTPGAGGSGASPEGGNIAANAAASAARVSVLPLTPRISPDAQRNLQMATAENAASQGQSTSQGARIAELQAGIAVLKQWVAADKEGTTQAIDDQTQLENKLKELHNAQISQGASAAKQSYADFAAGEKLKVTEAQGSSSKIQAIYNEWLTAAEGRYKQSAAVIAGIEREKVQAINTARLSEMKEDFKTQDQQTSLSLLNAQLASLKGGTVDTATKQQGPAADLARQAQYQNEAAQVEATAQKRIAAYQEEANTALQGSETQKSAQQEIMSLLISSKQQEVELYKKAAEAATQAAQKMAESFIKFFDQVGSQFESFSSSIINAFLAPSVDLIKQGMTTIKVSMQGTEIRQAFSHLFLGIADDFGKAIEGAISKTIANALSNGASNSISELLGNWLSHAFSSVVSNITGNAVGQAAGSAIGSGASQAVGSTAVVTAVGTAATATTTGISTAVATAAATQVTAITAASTAIVAAITTQGTVEDTLLVGLNAKPSALGFTYALGGIVPSAAGGMTVGGTGASLAILHAREMVLPAHISEGIQSMISGGRGSGNNSSNATLNYSPTINPASRSRNGTGMTRSEFSQMLAGHSGAMLGEARNMIRNGWRTA